MVSAFIGKTSSVQTGAKREGAFVFPWLLGLVLCLALVSNVLRYSAIPPYLRSTIYHCSLRKYSGLSRWFNRLNALFSKKNVFFLKASMMHQPQLLRCFCKENFFYRLIARNLEMVARCLPSSVVFRSVMARKLEITKGENSTAYRVRMSNYWEKKSNK